MAVGLGAGTVRYVDADAGRCAQAEALGAVAMQHEGAWPKRFDRAPVTVENTADAAGLACTIRSTDDYGTCTPVAIHFAAEVPVPLLAMYTRGITLEVGRADSRRHLPAVLRLVAAGRFDPRRIQTTIAPFEQAREAWLEDPQRKLVLTG
jgi:alcohol dehydrogenase